jgi:ethanolamine utilization protein EutA
MEINKVELLSVGIDVGSATSHLVFSHLLLVRDEMSPTLRFNIEERNVLYEGRIIPTPFLEDKTIDIEALTAFFKEGI